MPLFIVRFHGRLDGKRNVVAFKDGKWEGHYLQKKEAIFHSFVHRTYRELEEKTSQLHKESASLAVPRDVLSFFWEASTQSQTHG